MPKFPLIGLILVAVVAGVLAGPAAGRTAHSASVPVKTIRVGDYYFIRSGGGTIKVVHGTRVRWHFVGHVPEGHDVKVKKGPVHFHSLVKTSGYYSKTLTTKGTYVLYCTVHGYSAMHMTLKVT